MFKTLAAAIVTIGTLFSVHAGATVLSDNYDELPARLICQDEQMALRLADGVQKSHEQAQKVFRLAMRTQSCAVWPEPVVVTKKEMVLAYQDFDGDYMELWEIASPSGKRYWAFVLIKRLEAQSF